ncbi:MAG: type II toxin-antitoxin system HicB family antitoxin [Magnetococcales bacterium]|nr:type II toxin-antitoxin system HicB family antitoxin [Magnetococcales bacterium]MBF0322199.1 type II toxin-antitoxin system HicB family antitoxin [Magnetococcales bacterium]
MKNRLSYPVDFIEEDGSIRAIFPDWDATETFGDTEDEALIMAQDLLETMVSSAVADNRPIPHPSAAKRRPTVSLSAVSAAKVELYLALQNSGMPQAELARRLGWHPPQVSRLLDLRHKSKMDQLEQALAVLGKRLVISIQDAA